MKKAVEWSLAKYPEPAAYGNLGFWSGAYAGILYSEWHLRSGDRHVLKHLDALRDWAVNGTHPSSWGVPALGHGPSGLPYDQKALVAPACHLLVFEALAMRCGMKSGIWEKIREYGWWFSTAWEPGYGLRFTTPHMGAPYMGEDDLINATYALVLQGTRRSLHLTGSSESSRSR